MKLVYWALASVSSVLAASSADAQSFTTGQTVYATPSGASNGWYSGCVVKDGRSNRSYQVECGGTVWWITAENIRTTPPEAMPDPMSPGRTLRPVITPSHPPAAAAAQNAPRVGAPAARVATRVAVPPRGSAQNNGDRDLATVRRNIARDKAESTPAALENGKYTCYSAGQYTFSDLHITGAHSYSVEPGGSGRFNYANGALTFLSGPYAGAYSRMVDGHTIGVSTAGNHNLATQCGLEK
jgi:hypothetical protein